MNILVNEVTKIMYLMYFENIVTKNMHRKFKNIFFKFQYFQKTKIIQNKENKNDATAQ